MGKRKQNPTNDKSQPSSQPDTAKPCQPKKKKREERKLTDEHKVSVIKQVRAYPSLWDQNSDYYKKSDVEANSWKLVAEATGLTVRDCKRAWKSVTDSIRRDKPKPKKPKGASGDPAPDPALAEDEHDDADITENGDVNYMDMANNILRQSLEIDSQGSQDDEDETQSSEKPNKFRAEMKFWIERKAKVVTLCSLSGDEEEEESSEADDGITVDNSQKSPPEDPEPVDRVATVSNPTMVADPSSEAEIEEFSGPQGTPKPKDNQTPVSKSSSSRVSHYAYANHRATKNDPNIDKLTGAIQQLAEARKKSQVTTPGPQLRFQVQYAYVDKMLARLPEELAEDLLHDFTSSIQRRIRFHRSESQSTIVTVRDDDNEELTLLNL